MNKLFQYLSRPQPVILKRWHMVIIPSLIVLFILGIFQPFGIGVMIKSDLVVLAGFVLITVIGISIITCIFPLLFKRFYSENWTVGKALLNGFLIVLIISFGNTLYYYSFAHESSSFSWENTFDTFVSFLVITFLVSIVPFAIITFLQHNHVLSQHLQEAQELNKKLAEKTSSAQTVYNSNPIKLSGNTKDFIELHPEQFIYLEAYGNYVKVNYAEKGMVKQKLLRTTIKQMEDELASVSFIIRCHRAFLVNIKHIISVKGNSQGYKLSFDYPTEEIPVSRGYTKELQGSITLHSLFLPHP
ncbi:MAG: LytTR family transcriptional regulator [Tannerellaceae bacterium]|jgi:DNA-binding LytR/AlgR family response regulator|nr:LytTR family transcriptional regulator [Tannerellaceae bacterium]